MDLSAGVHRFGVISDDFRPGSGASLTDKTSTPLAFRTGGVDQRFDFVVPQAGLYSFRMVWYQRGGSAYVEWFSEDPNTGEKTLINDPNAPNAVKAYMTVTGPSLVVESSPMLVVPTRRTQLHSLTTRRRPSPFRSEMAVPVSSGSGQMQGELVSNRDSPHRTAAVQTSVLSPGS